MTGTAGAAFLSVDEGAGGARVPVTVLTGFLGSGKTTLLNRLLRGPDLAGTAVIINEFGAIGLDHDLVEHTREDLVLLANGCVCCTVRGDLVAALNGLATHHAARGIELRRVLIETTGLADPAPILHTLMGDRALAGRFHLAGVACTVDAVNGMGTLDRHREAVKQAAVADLHLITKADLVSPDAVDALRERLAGLSSVALVAVGAKDALDALVALIDAPARPRGYLPAQPAPLLMRRGAPASLHDDQVRSHVIVREQPLQREGFFAWLDMIAAMRGDDLLRVKGIVHLADSPEHPLVIHGVQHVFHPPATLERWPSEDRRTRIVFITRNIPREAIDDTLSVFEHRRRRAARPAPQSN
jgi:G3E family GTPase